MARAHNADYLRTVGLGRERRGPAGWFAALALVLVLAVGSLPVTTAWAAEPTPQQTVDTLTPASAPAQAPPQAPEQSAAAQTPAPAPDAAAPQTPAPASEPVVSQTPAPASEPAAPQTSEQTLPQAPEQTLAMAPIPALDPAQTPATIERLAGQTMIDTAIEISRTWTPGSTSYAVLATGRNFPDALAGGPLAYAVNAPLLLTTNPSSGLEASVKQELSRLGVTHVIILGGTSVVRSTIQTSLAKTYTVERVAGASLYDTAVAIANRLKAARGSAPSAAFLVDSTTYLDAVSVAPVAARLGAPILFSPRTSTSLASATKNYLAAARPSVIHVIGGTAAVRPQVMTAAWSASGAKTVTRVWGADAYQTNQAVFERWRSMFPQNGVITLATSRTFPDALTGGVFAAKLKAPVFLVDGRATLANPTIRAAATSVNATTAYVFGGPLAVSDLIANLTMVVTPTDPPPPAPTGLPYIQTATYATGMPLQAPTGWTTLQGAATDGKTIYAAFIKTTSAGDDATMRKFDLTGNMLASVKLGTQIGHANDLAYNSKTKQLLVAATLKRYAILDPATLAVVTTGTLTRDTDTACYNAARDQYVISGGLYDSNFNYIKSLYTSAYIDSVLKVRMSDGGVAAQGILCDGNYIYAMRAPFQNGTVLGDNTRVIQMDWTGKAVAAYQISIHAEGESMFVLNGQLYVTYNRGNFSGGDYRADFAVKTSIGVDAAA